MTSGDVVVLPPLEPAEGCAPAVTASPLAEVVDHDTKCISKPANASKDVSLRFTNLADKTLFVYKPNAPGTTFAKAMEAFENFVREQAESYEGHIDRGYVGRFVSYMGFGETKPWSLAPAEFNPSLTDICFVGQGDAFNDAARFCLRDVTEVVLATARATDARFFQDIWNEVSAEDPTSGRRDFQQCVPGFLALVSHVRVTQVELDLHFKGPLPRVQEETKFITELGLDELFLNRRITSNSELQQVHFSPRGETAIATQYSGAALNRVAEIFRKDMGLDLRAEDSWSLGQRKNSSAALGKQEIERVGNDLNTYDAAQDGELILELECKKTGIGALLSHVGRAGRRFARDDLLLFLHCWTEVEWDNSVEPGDVNLQAKPRS
ncbi:unnamed protein product [Amoebophrya sp. A120]|nr:unnamed protein product [Amoebophrya sp. A120]|eukprot:GSA120T00018713001.1